MGAGGGGGGGGPQTKKGGEKIREEVMNKGKEIETK